MAKPKKENGSAVDRLIASGFDGRELVFCADGPRAGAWYFLDWWKEQRRLAARDEEIGVRIGAFDNLAGESVLGYAPTKAGQPHPKNGGVIGQVLRWDPTGAVRAAEAAR